MAKGEMTAKQRKYVRGVVMGKSKTQAALAAGYAFPTAKTAVQSIEKPYVKEAIERALDKAGITEERIAQKINEGLEAKRTVGFGDDNVIEAPDYQVQHKYLETAIKLKGLDKSESSGAIINKEGGQMVVQITTKEKA